MKKTQAIVIKSSDVERINQAITALELAKKRALYSGGMKQTVLQRNAIIQEIQSRIDIWKEKLSV